jgi:hypothetical protein
MSNALQEVTKEVGKQPLVIWNAAGWNCKNIFRHEANPVMDLVAATRKNLVSR